MTDITLQRTNDTLRAHQARYGQSHEGSTNSVTFSGVSKSYPAGGGRLWALTNIDLSLEPRTFHRGHGPISVGKTTLLNCLLGLDKPDTGSIHVGGTDITRLDETRLAEMRRSPLFASRLGPTRPVDS